MSDPVSGRVFISYRRKDARGSAGRIYDRLADRFGDAQVFMDVDKIALGADFARVITQEVSTCQVLLAVIGPQWLTTTDEGGRRLEDPDDIVRLEIASALERDIIVIPILVEDAEMPRHQDLPENLAKLAGRNAHTVRHESFRSDTDRLLAAIEPILHPPASDTPISSGPARVGIPPSRPTEPEPTATASTAGARSPASSRQDAGWSSTQLRVLQHKSKWGFDEIGFIRGVAFSPDGRWLATCGDDKTARIWDMRSGQQQHTHRDRKSWVQAVAGVAPISRRVGYLAPAGEARLPGVLPL